jgi:anti-anti-sigma regulatory factor
MSFGASRSPIEMGPPQVVLEVRGPLLRSDLPGLYQRACRLLAHAGPETVVCDVTGLPGDAVAADALARLALAGRRHGCRFVLRGSSEQLRALLEFMGLAEVLPTLPTPPDGRPRPAAGEGRTAQGDAQARGRT